MGGLSRKTWGKYSEGKNTSQTLTRIDWRWLAGKHEYILYLLSLCVCWGENWIPFCSSFLACSSLLYPLSNSLNSLHLFQHTPHIHHIHHPTRPVKIIFQQSPFMIVIEMVEVVLVEAIPRLYSLAKRIKWPRVEGYEHYGFWKINLSCSIAQHSTA